ncbi:MAG TPA: hypothetical protein VGC07_09365 [Granulicella sp.]
MAQGINSTKTPARPSHEAIESGHHVKGQASSQRRLDELAMESAKRASNRIHSNEEETRKESLFTK